MEPVPRVGRVFFPLDEELALLPGRLTPKHQEHLAHLGSWMPYERAAQMLETLLDIQVSEPSVRRGTQGAGASYQARQTEQSQQLPSPTSEHPPAPEQLVMSTDGAYVPLVGGDWAEVRTVAIGELKADTKQGTQQVHARCLSYFSRMTDAETFATLAQGEMQRRAMRRAKRVGAVTDGAPWIQGFIDLHRSDAVRILDFPHAAEHLGLLVEALEQAKVPLPEQAVERSLHVLKHRGPALLLRWCEQLPDAIKALQAVQKPLEYFRKRISLMDYPTYQQQGWPIGSGMVESANKIVVQARLKGAGMHWASSHVNPMLALRGAVCSERWDEAWQDQLKEHRSQRTSTRQDLASTRLQDCLTSLLLLLWRSRPPVPNPAAPLPSPAAPTPPAPLPTSARRPKEPAATLPGSFRPSSHHPWKRAPSCAPNGLAKI
jgi:hypothetical protein